MKYAEDYFRITYSSGLMCNKILKVRNSFVWVGFLTSKILIYFKTFYTNNLEKFC